MIADWQAVPLRDANVSLIDCDHRTPPACEVGYPYVSIPQIRNGRIDLVAARRITGEHFAEWTRKANPFPYDVVLSRRCNPGETAFVEPGSEFALGQNLVLLRADGTKVDPIFLRWLVRGPEWWGQVGAFLNVGAIFDSLKCADVPKFMLRIPPLNEQRAIAHILGTLDDKIELNRRSNETLEEMARALFKDWFVDFGPVRARHAGREPYLAPELWSLFPNEFGDGETPTGWLNSTLGTEVRKANGLIQTGPFGSQLHASDYAAEGIPVVMPKDLVDRRISTTSVARIPPARTEPLARHRLIAGDIVYSRRGDVERFAVVSQRENGWLCGTGCLLVRPGSNWKSTAFLAETLDHPSTREWIVRHAIGATMPNLNTGILGNVPLLVPTEPVLVAFEQMCASWQKKKEAADAESETLATLRDTLLPKLLSGELRVRDAEKMAECVA